MGGYMASKEISTKSEPYTLTKYWDELIQTLLKLQEQETIEDKSDQEYKRIFEETMQMAEAGRKLEELGMMTIPSISTEGKRVKTMGERFDPKKFPLDTKPLRTLAELYAKHLKNFEKINSTSLYLRLGINGEKENVKKNILILETRIQQKYNELEQEKIRNAGITDKEPENEPKQTVQDHIEQEGLKGEFHQKNNQQDENSSQVAVLKEIPKLEDEHAKETTDLNWELLPVEEDPGVKEKEGLIQKCLLQHSGFRSDLLKRLDEFLLTLFKISFFDDSVPEDDYFLIMLENRFLFIENHLLKIEVSLRKARARLQEDKYLLDLQRIRLADEEAQGITPPVVRTLSSPLGSKALNAKKVEKSKEPTRPLACPLKFLNEAGSLKEPEAIDLETLCKDIVDKQKVIVLLDMKLRLILGLQTFYDCIHKHEKAWYLYFRDISKQEFANEYWVSLITLLEKLKALISLFQDILILSREENETLAGLEAFIKSSSELQAEMLKYCQHLGSLVLKPESQQLVKTESALLCLFEQSRDSSEFFEAMSKRTCSLVKI